MRILCTVALAALLAAAPASAGIYYEATTTTDASQGQDSAMTVHGWVDGPKARIVFTDSDNPAMKTNSYLLTTDGGKTLYMVDPEEKTYMEWDLAGLLGGVGAMLQAMGGMVDFDFSDPEVKKLAEEAGPAILGYPTTHYRYQTSYSIDIKVFGMVQSSKSTTVQDSWATDELDAEGLGVWLRAEPPKTGIEGLDTFIEKQMGTVEGFPLKTVAVTTSVDQQGQESSSTTTTEVTTLREEAVAGSQFELPAGYQKTEMPDLSQMMAGQGRR